MRTALTVVLLGMVVSLTGCIVPIIPSLHPFYTAKDLVFDPALVGSWEQQQAEGEAPRAEPPQAWTFKQSESEAKAYDLTVSVKDHSASFSAHLAKFGDALFLDLLPNELQIPEFKPEAEESESPEEEAGAGVTALYIFHYVPAHSVWRVRLDGNELRLNDLDGGWVAEQVRERTLGLRCEDVSGTPVLTASPEELRKFLLKHRRDDKAFPVFWCVCKRQEPAPPEPKREGHSPAK